MKKNVKIVGAAAAALLALAPVVVPASTADAAVKVNGSFMNFTSAGQNVLNLNISFDAVPYKTTVKDAIKSMKFSLGIDGHGEMPATIEAEDISITNNEVKLKDTDTLNTNNRGLYQIKIGSLKIKGLPVGQKYAIAGGWLDSKFNSYDFSTTKFSSEELAKSHKFVTAGFSESDPSVKDKDDFAFTKNHKVLPSVPYEQGVTTNEIIKMPTNSDTISISEVVNKIAKQGYAFKMNQTLESHIDDGSGFLNYDNSEDTNSDSEEVNMAITNMIEYALKYANVPYKDGKFTIPESKKLSTKCIYITTDGLHHRLQITLDFTPDSTSKDNTATDNNNSSATDTPTTTPDNNSSETTDAKQVTDTKQTPATDTSATKSNTTSSTTSDNKSATKDKNKSEEKLGKKKSITLMYTAYVYNKNHDRVSNKKIKAFTKIKTYGRKTYLSDGVGAYQVGKGQYIVASNITGTKRTLKRNAFVYATSTKRAKHKMLKKGAKVTTYGPAIKFKNGKRYYRIEGATKNKKMYVKAVNFK